MNKLNLNSKGESSVVYINFASGNCNLPSHGVTSQGSTLRGPVAVALRPLPYTRALLMGLAQARPLFHLFFAGPPGAATTARAQRDGTPQDAKLPADAPPLADLHSHSTAPGPSASQDAWHAPSAPMHPGRPGPPASRLRGVCGQA